MTSYYVFHATPMKWARVHVGDCRHCNYGKGQPTQHKTGSGATGWNGPFDTRDDAITFMKSLKLKDSKLCGTCKP
jgi:hypothetical protein